MITLNQNVYRCSYCNKYYLRPYPCTKHEVFCKDNPENRHRCFQFCKYLEIGIRNVGLETNISYHKEKTFTCMLNNTELYSFKAEKVNEKNKKQIRGRHIDLTGLTRMPLHCKEHKYEQRIIDTF